MNKFEPNWLIKQVPSVRKQVRHFWINFWLPGVVTWRYFSNLPKSKFKSTVEFCLRVFRRIEFYISALDRDGTFYFAEYRLLQGGLLILHHKMQVISSEQHAIPREFLEKVGNAYQAG